VPAAALCKLVFGQTEINGGGLYQHPKPALEVLLEGFEAILQRERQHSNGTSLKSGVVEANRYSRQFPFQPPLRNCSIVARPYCNTSSGMPTANVMEWLN